MNHACLAPTDPSGPQAWRHDLHKVSSSMTTIGSWNHRDRHRTASMWTTSSQSTQAGKLVNNGCSCPLASRARSLSRSA
ncbi:MAG: hypothetical protein L0L84_11495 [Acidipropionibacterium jensenii]|nr:hypothetical protein [Acidipropionibacterium jensenii]